MRALPTGIALAAAAAAFAPAVASGQTFHAACRYRAARYAVLPMFAATPPPTVDVLGSLNRTVVMKSLISRLAHVGQPVVVTARVIAPAGGTRHLTRTVMRAGLVAMRLLITITAALAACAPAALASPGDISTVAGTTEGFGGDGGPAIAAQLDGPTSVALTPGGGFLVGDVSNFRVRKVRADGTIVTVAGNGTSGYLGDNGPATKAQLGDPIGVAATRDSGLLIVDDVYDAVRKVQPDGTIATVAGMLNQAGYAGDNGPATSAMLSHPEGVAETADGGFLIADTLNDRVRKVFANGTIETVAGNGTAGSLGDGGPAVAAQLYYPSGVASTPDGGFLIADTANNRIRRVRPDGTIVTVAGAGAAGLTGDGGLATSALLSTPLGVAPTSDGGFLIADTLNHRIRRVSPAGVITTLAGITKGFSGDGGPAAAAQLNAPRAVAPTANGGALIADYNNARIRAIAGAAPGNGPAAVAPAPPTHVRAPAFGSRTNVSLSLTHARIRAGATLGVTVRNANTFAISGSIGGRSHRVRLAAKRFAVAASGRTRLAFRLSARLRARLSHTRRLAVALTARVTDPAGNTRRITRTLIVRRGR
jgi:NHL repeat